MIEQTLFEISKKEIHLDIYVDESKDRKYEINNKKEVIDYIMIMAVPTDKKISLYQKINNARCLNTPSNVFEKCVENCKYHLENNREIHYTNIQRENGKYKIADRWLDILLNNNFNDERSIYFNVLGIIESNLDISLFGDERQFGNIYTRFFRTALLRLLKMFNNYDKIIIEHIYHDKTTEMENHKYFKTSSIKKISMQELVSSHDKIKFNIDKIEFIDSDHKKGLQIESQFIQFVDIILGLTCNVIHNDAKNIAKVKLTEKIYPLISRILDKKQYLNKNSKYNYFNKQTIGFFPYVSKDKMAKQCKEIYGNGVNIDNILKNGNFFCNSKQILFKIDNGQMSLF